VRRLILVTLVAAATSSAPAAAQGPFGDAGGFYSVLGVGQGQTVNAVDLEIGRAHV